MRLNGPAAWLKGWGMTGWVSAPQRFCEHFGVDCINLETLMSREGWQF